MTFAFGQRARREVIKNISNLRSFEHGGISGRLGGCTRINKLPRAYAAHTGLHRAYYVVYCYDTPIAWVTMADDANEEGRVNFMPDWQYSATTTYYQKLVWEAWGDDKISDPNKDYSREENAGTVRGRSSDERYGRVVPAPPARRPRTPSNNYSDETRARLVTNHRGVQYDPQVERDTSYERDMAEARDASYRRDLAVRLAGAPSRTSYAPPGGEAAQRQRMARLLDARYSDPDWTPEPLSDEAEARDYRRVLRDLNEHRNPAHP